MSQIILFSKEDNLFFSFDEMCLFVQNTPLNKKLSGVSFEVLRYLAECSPEYISYDQLFEEVWEKRLKKERPLDNSRIREVLQDIRKYLCETIPYKYIQSENGKCRCTLKILSIDDELISLNTDIDNLNQKMSELLKDLERLQYKLEFADNKNKRDFIEIYSKHFDNLLFSFEILQDKIEKTKHEIELIRGIQSAITTKRIGKVFDSNTEGNNLSARLVSKASDTIQNAVTQIEDIAIDLEETICDWMLSTTENDERIKVLYNLPKNRKNALILFELTKSYDLIEIYSLLFLDYKALLKDEELEFLKNRAESIFEFEVIEDLLY